MADEQDLEVIIRNSDTSRKNIFQYSFEFECPRYEEVKKAITRTLVALIGLGKITLEDSEGARIQEGQRVFYEISYDQLDDSQFRLCFQITSGVAGIRGAILGALADATEGRPSDPSPKLDAHSFIDYLDQEVRKGENGSFANMLVGQINEQIPGLRSVKVRYEGPQVVMPYLPPNDGVVH